MAESGWLLVADIGGTNARFAAFELGGAEGGGRLGEPVLLAVRDHPTLEAALAAFLARAARPQPLLGACLAVAAPVEGPVVRLVNGPWVVDRAAVSRALGGVPVHLVNDFEAVAAAIPALEAGDWRDLRPGRPDPERPSVVLGPGTGLGVASLVPTPVGPRVVAGEGGHVDYAPVDETEMALLGRLTARFGRVSAERVLSGPGLVHLAQALAELRGLPPPPVETAALVAASRAGDPLAVEALAVFFRSLGSFAGNLALILGAKGGVWLAGGILPRLVEELTASDFAARFLAKGRYAAYLEPIPVRLITRPHPGLLGAARLYLEKGANGRGSL
ncbi:MAG: glucokinase [Porticoccaceae bacterium]|nr:MAG: glucokinase [Porticoccaceae bacterium]